MTFYEWKTEKPTQEQIDAAQRELVESVAAAIGAQIAREEGVGG